MNGIEVEEELKNICDTVLHAFPFCTNWPSSHRAFVKCSNNCIYWCDWVPSFPLSSIILHNISNSTFYELVLSEGFMCDHICMINTVSLILIFISLYIYTYILNMYHTNERKLYSLYTHTRVKLAMRVLIHYFCFSFSFELATNASGLRDHFLISVKFIYSNFYTKKNISL